MNANRCLSEPATDQLLAFEAQVAMLFAGRYAIRGDCWEWLGHRHNGYGRLSSKRIGRPLVHRLVLALRLGRPVDGMALHRCDNPPCFRPRHIYEGDAAQNTRDRDSRGRGAVGARHAKTKLTPEQVREICRRYQPGLNRWRRGNAAELAAQFGIAKKYIPLIIKNGHWSLRNSPSDKTERTR